MSDPLELAGAVVQVIAGLVQAGTSEDSTDSNPAPAAPDPEWEERKQDAIEHFRDRPWADDEPVEPTGRRTSAPPLG